MKLIRLQLLVLFLAAGCEEEIDTPGSDAFQPVIVVEGVFTDEHNVQSIKLSSSSRVNNDELPVPVSNASVSITDGRTVFPLVERAPGSGVYETTTAVAGEIGKQYTLNIQHDGKVHEATDRMEPAGDLERMVYTNAGDGYYNWEVPKNYSIEPGITYEWVASFHHPTGQVTTIVYYNFTGLETSALFSMNQTSRLVRFEPGTKIVQRKFSLTREFYAYLKAVYAETVWKGDLYDVTPANPPTNLSNGAQGYFRVSAVATLEHIAD